MNSSGLSGVRYAGSRHDKLTDDRAGTGRWVASDESGWDGEQLLDRTDRFLTVGSVAVDDTTAQGIVSELRERAHLHQGDELKMAMFRRGNSRRTQALVDLFTEVDLLRDRFSVYFVDKRYMACSKLVDLLVEEVTYERGFSILEDGTARRMARIIALRGASAVGEDQFMDLLRAVVRFASAGNVGEAQVTTQSFMQTICSARDSAVPGNVRTILSVAAEGERHARDLVSGKLPLKHLEPLIPAIPAVGRNWAERLDFEVRLLTDEHREITDKAIEEMTKAASLGTDPAFALGVPQPKWGVRIFRGRSNRHPSIQLADLVAGAGLEVSRHETGKPTEASEALRPLIMEAMDAYSLLPHDNTEKLIVA